MEASQKRILVQTRSENGAAKASEKEKHSQKAKSSVAAISPRNKAHSHEDIKDDSLQIRTNNYFKMVLLIVDIAGLVIKDYIDKEILKDKPFKSFLNESITKHSLFHCYKGIVRCCECPPGVKKPTNSNNLTHKQLQNLYDKNDNNKNTSHTIFKKKDKQECICSYTAKQKITIRDLDITLLNCVINAATTSMVDQRVNQITNIRNEIFHFSDSQQVDSDYLIARWPLVAGSIMGISNKIGVTYANNIRLKIEKLFRYQLKVNATVAYERLCTEYWETKCTEFDLLAINVDRKHLVYSTCWKIQEEESTKCKDFRMSIYDLPTEDQEEFIKQLPKLESKIQNTEINITVYGRDNLEQKDNRDTKDVSVSVLLNLKVPTEWSKEQIINAVTEMRLQRSSDMELKIKAFSSEDLSVIVDLERKILRDDDKLSTKINNMMRSILSDAGINTEESAKVEVDVGISNQTVDDNIYSTPNISAETGELPLENHDKQNDSLSETQDTEEVSSFKSLSHEQDQTYQHHFNQIEAKFLRKIEIVQHVSSDTVNRECVVINNKIVVSDYDNSKLVICDMDKFGDPENIPLSGQPLGVITVTGNEVAVWYNKDTCSYYIEIIDIENGQVKKKINKNGNGKMLYQDGYFYVVIDGKKINEVNLNGKEVADFAVELPDITNITSDTDRLFLVYYSRNELQCWNLSNKSKIWKFKNDKMRNPTDVTIDSNRNVYVTGQDSKNVLIVSPDGKIHKELLTESQTKEHGLLFPISIHYDKLNNRLIAFNAFKGFACLYEIMS